ncbi:hypothetical protein [Sporanaerobacter acetigenes]|uniref:hypothetical protein n=1 Tax=Sporanaerobacter acetigenes TaxID=165813 RepID=UPI003322D8E4
MIDEIVEAPKYDFSNRKKELTDEVIEKIEFYFKEEIIDMQNCTIIRKWNVF